jgi:protein Mpv17
MQSRSPRLTQLDSALIIYFLGDLSAQTMQTHGFTDADARYEPLRALRAMCIGGLCCIPSYRWFLWLGRNFNYRAHWRSLAAKIVVSQMLFTPVFNSYFFGMHTLLAGGGWRDVRDRLVQTVPVSWVNSWKLWPAVTAFSFTFVPPHHRSVFAGVIAIGWQTYLSWLNRAAEAAAGFAKDLPD